eukprot:6200401-Pleurochrysis_carterae.AAC.1
MGACGGGARRTRAVRGARRGGQQALGVLGGVGGRGERRALSACRRLPRRRRRHAARDAHGDACATVTNLYYNQEYDHLVSSSCISDGEGYASRAMERPGRSPPGAKLTNLIEAGPLPLPAPTQSLYAPL